MKAAPDRFWQARQEQMLICTGSPRARAVSAPHEQEAVLLAASRDVSWAAAGSVGDEWKVRLVPLDRNVPVPPGFDGHACSIWESVTPYVLPRHHLRGGKEREGESAALQALLVRDDVRFVTVTGPGGIGKTRLAIEVAAAMTPAFAGGAVYLDLSPESDPALVMPLLANTFGIYEAASERRARALINAVGDKPMLLVLDNLAGHKTPELVCWLFDHGIMPLYTPVGGSWLNMAESLQRILKRRALDGRYPTDAGQIMAWFEAAARHWDAAPTPFVWGGKRATRRRRQRERRHRLGGSGACTRTPLRRGSRPLYGLVQAN